MKCRPQEVRFLWSVLLCRKVCPIEIQVSKGQLFYGVGNLHKNNYLFKNLKNRLQKSNRIKPSAFKTGIFSLYAPLCALSERKRVADALYFLNS